MSSKSGIQYWCNWRDHFHFILLVYITALGFSLTIPPTNSLCKIYIGSIAVFLGTVQSQVGGHQIRFSLNAIQLFHPRRIPKHHSFLDYTLLTCPKVRPTLKSPLIAHKWALGKIPHYPLVLYIPCSKEMKSLPALPRSIHSSLLPTNPLQLIAALAIFFPSKREGNSPPYIFMGRTLLLSALSVQVSGAPFLFYIVPIPTCLVQYFSEPTSPFPHFGIT